MSLDEVIKGLEELYGFLFREYANIPAEESKIYYERTCAIRDAIALLKEQEAVYPSWQNGKMYCGHCGSKFPPRVMMRFCHRCGVPIKLKVNDIA